MIISGRLDLKEATIEAGVWVGRERSILRGVRVGYGVIVAAKSVVTKGVPLWGIYGGDLAKKVKERFAFVEGGKAHDTMLGQPPVRGLFCSGLDE